MFCSTNETNELRESADTVRLLLQFHFLQFTNFFVYYFVQNDPIPAINTSQTHSNAQQTAVCMEPPSYEEAPPLGNSSWSSPKTRPIHLRPVTLAWQSDKNDGNSSQKSPPVSLSPKSPTDSILGARLKSNFSSDNLVHLAKNTGSFLLSKSSGMKNSKNNAVKPTNDKKQ